MSARRKARELTLKALYACEVGEGEPAAAFDDLARETKLPSDAAAFARRLFETVTPEFDALDVTIEGLSKHWPIERIAPIDKSILRLAITELQKFPDIPKKVTINEAVELAKRYGSSDSAAFINGILDTFAKTV
jgi:transcription antitermination factor NusB